MLVGYTKNLERGVPVTAVRDSRDSLDANNGWEECNFSYRGFSYTFPDLRLNPQSSLCNLKCHHLDNSLFFEYGSVSANGCSTSMVLKASASVFSSRGIHT